MLGTIEVIRTRVESYLYMICSALCAICVMIFPHLEYRCASNSSIVRQRDHFETSGIENSTHRLRRLTFRSAPVFLCQVRLLHSLPLAHKNCAQREALIRLTNIQYGMVLLVVSMTHLQRVLSEKTVEWAEPEQGFQPRRSTQ